MNICTIIAGNYLAHARVLAESFRRHHPDGRCHVLVVDDEHGSVVADDERFEVVRPSELGVEDFDRMRSAYSVVELSTALKPWLLRFMLTRHDDGSGIAYLDPDIQVFSRMVELEAALREHAVVLTPHVLRGMPRDGKRPSETEILQAGVYNLGFVGMSQRPDAHAVIDWWAERLLTDCYVAPERGYFVDQRWVDFVPGLIGDLRILRDPAYNVAYWNLPERAVERRADRYCVDGRPLRFFHFSGYRPTARTVLSLHQSRVELTEHAALLALCDAYGDALEARGYHEVSTLPYGHDAMPSGVRITGLMRTLYRRAAETGAVRDSLFTPAGELAFTTWMMGPADGAPGLNRYLHAAWEERADLRRAFPGVAWGEIDGYVGWLTSGGSEQLGAPASLLPRVEEPAPEPPAAPAVEAAPAPSAPEPSGINVLGYLRSELGVGEIARQLIGALDAAGVATTAVNVPGPYSRQGHAYFASSRADNPFPVNLVCVNADVLPKVAADVGERFFADRYNIGVWWWETSQFPATHDPPFELLDELWVGSRFIADALRPISPIPVIQMPMPVVFPEAAPFAAGEHGWPDAFTFLFSWDYRSVFERKNPLAVVEAYVAAFAADDGAALVLKSINHADDPANRARLHDAIAGRPDITVIEDYLDPADKDRLMRSCDCYVSLHRSEGFGLTIAEALFHARPVIATAYSGNVDLMDDSNSYPVGYRFVGIGDHAAPYPPGGVWAEPDVAEASRLMREVFACPAAAAPRAAKAARDMRLHHSAHAVGAAMRRRLCEIDPMPAAARGAEAPSIEHAVAPATATAIGRLLHRRGRPDVPSRFGWPGALARLIALRVMRPYTAYQVQVNDVLGEAVASLSEHADALAARAEIVAARADLDRAESHAALSAEVRRQKHDLAELRQRLAAAEGAREHPPSGLRNGGRPTRAEGWDDGGPIEAVHREERSVADPVLPGAPDGSSA